MRDNPVRLAVGLGAGNTSDFSIGSANGKYVHIWDHIGVRVSATTISLELGYAGLVAFLVFAFLILQDGVRLSRTHRWDAALGGWWAGVVLIFIIALIYKDLIKFNTIGFLFWYFSGLIVARAYLARLKLKTQSTFKQRSSTAIPKGEARYGT